MRNRADIEAAISALNKQIDEMEKQIKCLNDERYDLKQELYKLDVSERTDETLQSIYSISDENSIRIRLYSDTRTTPIMDSFMFSDKIFLIFEQAFVLGNSGKRISLVVVKTNRTVNYVNDGLTMTDLKKLSGTYISERSLEYTKKTSRKYSLYRELISINKQPLKTGDIVPFSIPCRLGGQTFKDQTGFGSEYCGEELIHQGKNYGETTAFLIIGVLIDKSPFE